MVRGPAEGQQLANTLSCCQMSSPQTRLGRALSRILWTQPLWQKQWDPLEAVTRALCLQKARERELSYLGSPSVSRILFILSSIFCVGPPPPSPKPKSTALWFTRPLSLLFFTVFSI